MFIAIERTSGGVSLFEVTDDTPDDQINAIVDKWEASAGESATSWSRVVTPAKDREFRDAWEVSDGEIGISMPKARKIHEQRIRSERNKRFTPLDLEFQKHDAQARYENNAAAIAEAKKVEAKRKALRDAPATVAADIRQAKTPEQLKAIWPDALNEEA